MFLDHTRRRTTGLLQTSDQLVAETSTWQNTTLPTDKYTCPGRIRTHDLSRWAAASNSVERSHKELLTCQVGVKIIQKIIRTVEQKHENASKNIMVQKDILYNKDSNRYPYWRLVLPTDLEIPVITYVCTLVGHSATENAWFSLPALFMWRAWDWESGRLFLDVILANGLNVRTGVVQHRT